MLWFVLKRQLLRLRDFIFNVNGKTESKAGKLIQTQILTSEMAYLLRYRILKVYTNNESIY